jgi:hypothetical protein
MQKRNRSRSRKMSGGFLDSLTNSISSGWNSLSQGASNAWNKTKTATENAYTSATSSSTTPSSYTPTTSVTPTYTTGGRKRSRKMRGGYQPNSSTTNLAFAASPISGIKSAQPHNWVGGKTKRHRKHKQSKSRRHRK